ADINFMDEINFERIAKSGLIVADLTGRNTYVMYGLGIAHSMGKETILLSQRVEDIPFDLRHVRVIIYEDDTNGRRGLREKLRQSFRSRSSRQGASPRNPQSLPSG